MRATVSFGSCASFPPFLHLLTWGKTGRWLCLAHSITHVPFFAAGGSKGSSETAPSAGEQEEAGEGEVVLSIATADGEARNMSFPVVSIRNMVGRICFALAAKSRVKMCSSVVVWFEGVCVVFNMWGGGGGGKKKKKKGTPIPPKLQTRGKQKEKWSFKI